MLSRALLVSIAPIAGSALYLVWLHHSLSRKVACKTTSTPQPPTSSAALPPELPDASSSHSVVMHEQARKAVPTAALPHRDSPDALLTAYMRLTMSAWAYYPPGWLIHLLLRAPADRATFASAYLRALEFREGDRVCGVYRVVRRSPTSVELLLDAPESYRGPPAKGLIVVGIERRGDQTVFLNNVFMWRGKDESPVPLESGLGQWTHAIIAMSLVETGTQQLMKSAKE